MDKVDFLNSICSSLGDAIVFVDKDGYIQMISDEYLNFLDLKRDDVVGKHVTRVIDNTRMHLVAKSRQKEIAELQMVRGQNIIATRAPLVFKGENIGAIGKVLFKNTEELNELYKRTMKMEREIDRYKSALKHDWARYTIDDIVTNNEKMLKVKEEIKRISKTNSNVLITGESGTGKELVAHAIYNESRRRGEPFIRVNCSAIPSELLESELFGYEEGSFTGAKSGGKIGKFEAADNGIIFLDEIGDLPLTMQGKLLRVLQENEIEKIGSIKNKNIDVRVIAVTNRDLRKMVDEGSFRLDLYYRLNVVELKIPSLRDRLDDLEILCKSIIRKLVKSEGIEDKTISKEALIYLENYHWPGNIRELENILERAINFMGKSTVITPKCLPDNIVNMKKKHEIKSLKDSVKELEKKEISRALICRKGNKAEVARLLGISRTSLYNKMEEYGL